MILAVELILAVITAGFVLLPLFRQRTGEVETEPPKAAYSEKRIRSAGTSGEDLEKQILQMRKRKALFCQQCGAKNPGDAKFCSSCAARLNKGNKNG